MNENQVKCKLNEVKQEYLVHIETSIISNRDESPLANNPVLKTEMERDKNGLLQGSDFQEEQK